MRLPGLFGAGLRKNVIYDLLHDNQVDRIHPGGVFQFYDTARLHRDILTALRFGLELVHLATEPLRTADVAAQVFGRKLPLKPERPARYDLRTRHAELFGGRGHYVAGRDEVVAGLCQLVAAHRQRAA